MTRYERWAGHSRRRDYTLAMGETKQPLKHRDPRQMVKKAVAGQVRSFFNDGTRVDNPIVRPADGLFAPDSVIRRVHGDVAVMMVGGTSSLLLQMLHPAVLGGVWDHSNFRSDMHARLRRTARFIAVTTYGGRNDAEEAIARVRRIHDKVSGTLPDGTPYAANDPTLLAWVHITEASSFLDAWRRYAEPGMTVADQNRYFSEIAEIGRALGADPVPHDRVAARRLVHEFRSNLCVTARTREVRQLVLAADVGNPMLSWTLAVGAEAAIDLLPDWARQMHGLSSSVLTRTLARAGTLGVAHALRWALR